MHIIFDLDGTLVDTGMGISNGVKYAGDEMGIEVPADRYDLFVGPPLYEFAGETLGLNEDDSERFITLFREYYRARGIDECSVYPGVEQMMKDLLDAGNKLYICTSKYEPSAVRMSDSLGFTPMLCGLKGAMGSLLHKGELLERLVEDFDVDHSDAVMVGDRATDIFAAKALEMKSVGVLYGYGKRDEIDSSQPDYSAQTVEDLSRYLLGQ